MPTDAQQKQWAEEKQIVEFLEGLKRTTSFGRWQTEALAFMRTIQREEAARVWRQVAQEADWRTQTDAGLLGLARWCREQAEPGAGTDQGGAAVK